MIFFIEEHIVFTLFHARKCVFVCIAKSLSEPYFVYHLELCHDNSQADASYQWRRYHKREKSLSLTPFFFV